MNPPKIFKPEDVAELNYHDSEGYLKLLFSPRDARAIAMFAQAKFEEWWESNRTKCTCGEYLDCARCFYEDEDDGN